MQPKSEAVCRKWLGLGVFERMHPLQLFNAILDTALSCIRKLVADNRPSTVEDFEVPLSLSNKFGVELPLIGKYLVHTWIYNSLVTEKVGKLDGAGVPMHLWDQQIMQVFDVLIPVINTMRKWLFKHDCRGLMGSLSAFFSLCYGGTGL
jgi:hypothetical protein